MYNRAKRSNRGAWGQSRPGGMWVSLPRGGDTGRPGRVGDNGPLGSTVHGARGWYSCKRGRSERLWRTPQLCLWVVGIYGRLRDQVSRQEKWWQSTAWEIIFTPLVMRVLDRWRRYWQFLGWERRKAMLKPSCFLSLFTTFLSVSFLLIF